MADYLPSLLFLLLFSLIITLVIEGNAVGDRQAGLTQRVARERQGEQFDVRSKESERLTDASGAVDGRLPGSDDCFALIVQRVRGQAGNEVVQVAVGLAVSAALAIPILALPDSPHTRHAKVWLDPLSSCFRDALPSLAIPVDRGGDQRTDDRPSLPAALANAMADVGGGPLAVYRSNRTVVWKSVPADAASIRTRAAAACTAARHAGVAGPLFLGIEGYLQDSSSFSAAARAIARHHLRPSCCADTAATIAPGDAVVHVRDFFSEGVRERWPSAAWREHRDVHADYYLAALTSWKERYGEHAGRIIIVHPPGSEQSPLVELARNASLSLTQRVVTQSSDIATDLCTLTSAQTLIMSRSTFSLIAWLGGGGGGSEGVATWPCPRSWSWAMEARGERAEGEGGTVEYYGEEYCKDASWLFTIARERGLIEDDR